MSAAQIGAGLGVPYLTSLSRLAGSNPSLPANAPEALQNRLNAGLTGWLLLTIAGGLIATAVFGWGSGVGPAVFLATLGFGCNYLAVLLPKGYRMPGTLIAISFWGNAAQLMLLACLVIAVPKAITGSTVLVIYSCAFIAPLLLSTRLGPFLQVPVLTIRDLWKSTRHHAREYASFLAQHVSHLLVVNLDILVLSRFAPASSVGGYAAVKTLMVIILLPATALFHLLIPESVRRLEGHPDPGDRHVLWVGVAGVTGAAIATILGSRSLMTIVYGSRFTGLRPTLVYAVIGAFAYGLGLLRGATWIAREHGSEFSALVILSALAQVAVIAFVPGFATVEGAARSWAATNASLLVVLFLLEALRRPRASET